jgi:gem associated protein 5
MPALLAVGGRERAVTLWAWDGQRVSLRQTLPLPRCPPHLSEAQRGRLWLSLAWAPRDTKQANSVVVGEDGGGGGGGRSADENEESDRTVWLVSASHGGDLLRWTINLDDVFSSESGRGDRGSGRGGRGQGGKSGGGSALATVEKFGPAEDAHTRTVFSVVVRGGTVMTTSLDRTLAAWHVATCRRAWGMTGLGGFVYAIAVNPEDPFSTGVGCGDGTVRALDLGHSAAGGGGQGGALLWRGLPQTKTTCVAWHPVDAEVGHGGGVGGRGGVLAVGLEDGRVVIVDTLTGGRFVCVGTPDSTP